MLSQSIRFLAAVAIGAALCSSASAATLTTGFTVGVTEGNKQNRRTVVGTDDLDKDAGVISLPDLDFGEVIGIYGRIVGARDYFEFEFVASTGFEIAFDLDGYYVYKSGASGDTEFVSTSGLVSQSDVPGETNGNSSDDKRVKFSLSKDGGAYSDVFRTSNILAGADDSDRILFSASEGGTYRLSVDGLGNRIAALYDINVSVAPVPVPAGAVLMITGLAGLGALRRKRSAATRG